MNECLLFRVDKHFGGLIGKMTSIFFRVLPAILAGILGVNYDVITNLDKETLVNVWKIYNKNLGIISAIFGGIFLGMICSFINYMELQTRRHIIEYQIEARGLKNRLYNTDINMR